MPNLRPGAITYHVATKQVVHDDPCIEDNVAGIAIKQQEQSWTLGIANRNVVQIGESFAIAGKGKTLVREALFTSPPGLGDPVFIKISDNTLHATTGSGIVPFGRVVALPGDAQGTPTGYCGVDMDGRDTL